MYLGTKKLIRKVSKKSDRYAPRVGEEFPASIDWRKKGAVAADKDHEAAIQRRLAQNREAARKIRLRKKILQRKQICALRTALNAQISDAGLGMLVETGMNHYSELFRLKSTAAKADVFYVMSGMWKTSAKQFFSWIGGFRPSELLKGVAGPSQLLEPWKGLTKLSLVTLSHSLSWNW